MTCMPPDLPTVFRVSIPDNNEDRNHEITHLAGRGDGLRVGCGSLVLVGIMMLFKS